jgi:hypothetical protein
MGIAVPVALLAAALLPLYAQRDKADEPTALQYEGNPLRVPVACAGEDMAELGTVCSAQSPCPVYLELTAVHAVGTKIFAAGNLHSRSTTLYSVLLMSDNGGLRWTEPAGRIRRAGLDRVFFFDGDRGWAAGHLLDGQPRDPFFLLTTDGGRNWRLRPVFEDQRFGSIEDFWFDSERTGTLLLDRLRPDENGTRYERYETMTGAESWMIREISAKPIEVRRIRPPQPAAEWRISTAREGSAWAVEKQEPGGWAAVAEFQVEAGVCAPAEEVAEAPPEPVPAPLEEQVAPGGVFVIGSKPGPAPGGPASGQQGPPALKKPPP